MEWGAAGGTLPCAFNAANEEAVYAFLKEQIRYLDIPYITAKVAESHKNIAQPTIEDIEYTDTQARLLAREIIAKL
mgnify:CR=1 FL=1